MKTITIYGTLYSQHISNYVRGLKENSDFRLYGVNKAPEKILGNGYKKLSDDYFDHIYNTPRLKYKICDAVYRTIISLIFIIKVGRKSDIVQFNYISYIVLPMIIALKLFTSVKISSFVYGSDFLRAGRVGSILLKYVFALSDRIVCDSTTVINKLKDAYPSYNNKMYCCFFGSPIIDKILDTQYVKTEKPSKKPIIMCGYNGSKAHQHLKIIDSLQHIASNYYWIIVLVQ